MISPRACKWLIARKAELKKSEGNQYFRTSRISSTSRKASPTRHDGHYLDRNRFVWVFFADSLCGRSTTGARLADPDEQVISLFKKKCCTALCSMENVSKLPGSLAHYLDFVTRTLEDNQKKGAIAEKFEVAYFRSMKSEILHATRLKMSIPGL